MRSYVTQVDHLTRLAFRKERSVTSRRCLRDLITHREEVCAVLACRRIGVDDDAFLLIVHLRVSNRVYTAVVQVMYLMRHGVFEGVTRQVVLVAYDMRDVIAFQLQYQLQVIAQVIRTVSEAQ